MHLTSQLAIYYVLTQVTKSPKEIQASSFNVCWARQLRIGSLSTKIFCSLALFSEQEWPLRAC